MSKSPIQKAVGGILVNKFISIFVLFVFLVGCNDTDTVQEYDLNKPILIPSIGYDLYGPGLSGFWSADCVSSAEFKKFRSVKFTYVMSQNLRSVKQIFSSYKQTECNGERTILTFVMSCASKGSVIAESGVMMDTVHCKDDRFWRSSSKEKLVELSKKVDFKIVFYQSGDNILYSNFTIDSSDYPTDLIWDMPYNRRIGL